MDFELSSDQQALAEGMRAFCDGRFAMATVRSLEDVGIERGLWRELAEMGVFSLRLPEGAGGVGLGWADAALAFEELGRALVPGPLVWTHLAAGLVPGAAEGTVVVTGTWRDEPTGVIPFAGIADAVIVLDDAGVWLVDGADLVVDPVALPLDPWTPCGVVQGQLPQGRQIGDAHAAAALRRGGAALVAAQLLGLAEASTDLSVAFARERVQFDRPIGTFQALKHLMADMLVRTEVARSAVYAAGVSLDDPEVGDADRAVAAAKVTATEAALGNTKTCIQVHGGMGYTWEVDAHLFFKRAYALAPEFGSVDDWSELLADLLDAAG